MTDARIEERLDLLRRVARGAVVVLWVGSVFSPLIRVHSSWVAALLALAAAAVAVPSIGAFKQPPEAWTVVSLTPMLALITALRAFVLGDGPDLIPLALGLLCGEWVGVMFLLGIGRKVDAFVTQRLDRGRGWMAFVAVTLMAVGAFTAVVALTRFPGRVEPTLARQRGGVTAVRGTLLGTYQALGAPCPPRCDRGPGVARRDHRDAIEVVDRVMPGVALTRSRLGPMSTRFTLTVSPRVARESVPPTVLTRTVHGAQPMELYLDPGGGLLLVTAANHPETSVRLSDGVAFTRSERSRARETSFHAPVAYVLTSLVGLALTAWFLRIARRTRRRVADAPSWRDARIEADGMVHFPEDLPPSPPPESERHLRGPVVVTRCTVPVGVGYRSAGVVTVHELQSGTREDFTRHLLVRATAWEHAAVACVMATHAPLVGAWLLRETW